MIALSNTSRSTGSASIESRDGVRASARRPLPPAPVAHREAALDRGEEAIPISVLSSGLVISGVVATDGALHVDGQVDGPIFARCVTVGAGARYEGQIVAEHVAIEGRTAGRIMARTVRIAAHASFEGDVTCQHIAIDDGADFTGAVQRRVDPAAWAAIGRSLADSGVTLPEDAQRTVDAIRAAFA